MKLSSKFKLDIYKFIAIGLTVPIGACVAQFYSNDFDPHIEFWNIRLLLVLASSVCNVYLCSYILYMCDKVEEGEAE